ncbi:class I SAM-dependent methyltransferase [Streptosporangiaceae bacterium NEAU-GS5]|nr:class I SAM-dependent methyltransferase [Streptosporangiaceae bacterium NEAU-GS5]
MDSATGTNPTGQPSRTALLAAAARAAHLIVDGEPTVFADPLAYRLLGDGAEELVSYHRLHGEHMVLAGARAAVTTRSRYTEERLARAADAGITQYVILGAGLDSFAYRSDADVRVFEVDHPATQEWKRARLDEARIPVPDSVAYVPMDFESELLLDRLPEAGFDVTRPALVSWLGVLMYLSGEAIDRTLTELSAFAPRTEIVADYMLRPELCDEDGRMYGELVGATSAQGGEPWLSRFSPEEVAGLLKGHGFEVIEQATQRDSVDLTLWERSDAFRALGLAMVAHARVTL